MSYLESYEGSNTHQTENNGDGQTQNIQMQALYRYQNITSDVADHILLTLDGVLSADFSHNEIDSFPSSVCASLISLDISYNRIEQFVIPKLTVNLLELNLSHNCIRDLQALSMLINLQHLNLGNNQIRRIDGLESMQSLKVLHLRNNFIASVQNLRLLSYNSVLSELSLDGNDIMYEPYFRVKLLHNVPNLKYLNGNTFWRRTSMQSTTVNDNLTYGELCYRHPSLQHSGTDHVAQVHDYEHQHHQHPVESGQRDSNGNSRELTIGDVIQTNHILYSNHGNRTGRSTVTVSGPGSVAKRRPIAAHVPLPVDTPSGRGGNNYDSTGSRRGSNHTSGYDPQSVALSASTPMDNNSNKYSALETPIQQQQRLQSRRQVEGQQQRQQQLKEQPYLELKQKQAQPRQIARPTSAMSLPDALAAKTSRKMTVMATPPPSPPRNSATTTNTSSNKNNPMSKNNNNKTNNAIAASAVPTPSAGTKRRSASRDRSNSKLIWNNPPRIAPNYQKLAIIGSTARKQQDEELDASRRNMDSTRGGHLTPQQRAAMLVSAAGSGGPTSSYSTAIPIPTTANAAASAAGSASQRSTSLPPSRGNPNPSIDPHSGSRSNHLPPSADTASLFNPNDRLGFLASSQSEPVAWGGVANNNSNYYSSGGGGDDRYEMLTKGTGFVPLPPPPPPLAPPPPLTDDPEISFDAQYSSNRRGRSRTRYPHPTSLGSLDNTNRQQSNHEMLEEKKSSSVQQDGFGNTARTANTYDADSSTRRNGIESDRGHYGSSNSIESDNNLKNLNNNNNSATSRRGRSVSPGGTFRPVTQTRTSISRANFSMEMIRAQEEADAIQRQLIEHNTYPKRPSYMRSSSASPGFSSSRNNSNNASMSNAIAPFSPGSRTSSASISISTGTSHQKHPLIRNRAHSRDYVLSPAEDTSTARILRAYDDAASNNVQQQQQLYRQQHDRLVVTGNDSSVLPTAGTGMNTAGSPRLPSDERKEAPPGATVHGDDNNNNNNTVETARNEESPYQRFLRLREKLTGQFVPSQQQEKHYHQQDAEPTAAAAVKATRMYDFAHSINEHDVEQIFNAPASPEAQQELTQIEAKYDDLRKKDLKYKNLPSPPPLPGATAATTTVTGGGATGRNDRASKLLSPSAGYEALYGLIQHRKNVLESITHPGDLSPQRFSTTAKTFLPAADSRNAATAATNNNNSSNDYTGSGSGSGRSMHQSSTTTTTTGAGGGGGGGGGEGEDSPLSGNMNAASTPYVPTDSQYIFDAISKLKARQMASFEAIHAPAAPVSASSSSSTTGNIKEMPSSSAATAATAAATAEATATGTSVRDMVPADVSANSFLSRLTLDNPYMKAVSSPPVVPSSSSSHRASTSSGAATTSGSAASSHHHKTPPAAAAATAAAMPSAAGVLPIQAQVLVTPTPLQVKAQQQQQQLLLQHQLQHQRAATSNSNSAVAAAIPGSVKGSGEQLPVAAAAGAVPVGILSPAGGKVGTKKQRGAGNSVTFNLHDHGGATITSGTRAGSGSSDSSSDSSGSSGGLTDASSGENRNPAQLQQPQSQSQQRVGSSVRDGGNSDGGAIPAGTGMDMGHVHLADAIRTLQMKQSSDIQHMNKQQFDV